MSCESERKREAKVGFGSHGDAIRRRGREAGDAVASLPRAVLWPRTKHVVQPYGQANSTIWCFYGPMNVRINCLNLYFHII